MDWNWFFSTVAQSSAAIVGIFSAFLISKILGNKSSHTANLRKIRELITEAEYLKDLIGTRYFDWYNKYTNKSAYDEVFEKIIADLEDGVDGIDFEKIYFEADFSKYEDIDEVIKKLKEDRALYYEKYLEAERTRKQREEEEARKRAEEAKARESLAAAGLGGLYRAYGMGQPLDRLVQPAVNPLFEHEKRMNKISMDKSLNEEREKIEEIYIKIKDLSKRIKGFTRDLIENDISRNQISLLIILVFMLFCLGVIYPISFLPLNPNKDFEIALSAVFPTIFSIKGFFLSLMSSVFFVILYIFFVMNYKMIYPRDFLDELISYETISSYSEYLEAHEKYYLRYEAFEKTTEANS